MSSPNEAPASSMPSPPNAGTRGRPRSLSAAGSLGLPSAAPQPSPAFLASLSQAKSLSQSQSAATSATSPPSTVTSPTAPGGFMSAYIEHTRRASAGASSMGRRPSFGSTALAGLPNAFASDSTSPRSSNGVPPLDMSSAASVASSDTSSSSLPTPSSSPIFAAPIGAMQQQEAKNGAATQLTAKASLKGKTMTSPTIHESDEHHDELTAEPERIVGFSPPPIQTARTKWSFASTAGRTPGQQQPPSPPATSPGGIAAQANFGAALSRQQSIPTASIGQGNELKRVVSAGAAPGSGIRGGEGFGGLFRRFGLGRSSEDNKPLMPGSAPSMPEQPRPSTLSPPASGAAASAPVDRGRSAAPGAAAPKPRKVSPYGERLIVGFRA